VNEVAGYGQTQGSAQRAGGEDIAAGVSLTNERVMRRSKAASAASTDQASASAEMAARTHAQKTFTPEQQQAAAGGKIEKARRRAWKVWNVFTPFRSLDSISQYKAALVHNHLWHLKVRMQDAPCHAISFAICFAGSIKLNIYFCAQASSVMY
jgi:hypothetical protein